MQKGTILVKEVIGSGIESFKIDHCLTTPFPVKDIFKVRQQVLPVRSVVGNTCVAYFGEVEFKVYWVSKDDLSVRLVCEKVHYKGFYFFDEDCLHSKPEVKVTTTVKDVFTEIVDPETIRIFVVLSTELILTKTTSHENCSHAKPIENHEYHEHEHNEHHEQPDVDNCYQIEILDKGSSPGISVEVLPE